ncbi:uncharacterized protein PG998_013741 [Apiospora kogelbergensis]|uniref:uncharacterized protein n=1 Tax=Apiospora kogelbergensis TaxID=1337665 RepID=UPI0031303C5F
MSGKSSKPPDSVAVRKSGMGKLERLPISNNPLDHLYERIKTIDDGTGNMGAMNAGVHIVRAKKTGQVIVHYVAAYVNMKPPYEAAAYLEYCDRGSLRDMIKLYMAEKKTPRNLYIPESFIWHAFLGLADALNFLKTGKSFISVELQKNDTRTWKPIIHHIFLRSRDTPNSTKPPYVLLSDFGIACYDDIASKGSSNLGPCAAAGTPEYHAPELCFHPYPSAGQAQTQQSSPHTGRSDVFAVALLMYCLCERAAFPHIDPRCLPLRSAAALGRTARPARLDISARGVYSDYLARVVGWAGAREPKDRPDATQLVDGVQKQCQLWKADPNWTAQVAETLPSWAAPKRTV